MLVEKGHRIISISISLVTSCGRKSKSLVIDKTQLALCVSNTESPVEHSETPSPVYIVYFQGEWILCHYVRVLVKLTCLRERLVLASQATISLSSLTRA